MIQITDHAELRWTSRIQNDNNSREKMREAFEEAVTIGWTHRRGQSKYHPPTGAVLIYKIEHNNPVILTVLNADKEKIKNDPCINADHLVECKQPTQMTQYLYSRVERKMKKLPTGCGQLFDPGQTDDGSCPWCGNNNRIQPLQSDDDEALQQM